MHTLQSFSAGKEVAHNFTPSKPEASNQGIVSADIGTDNILVVSGSIFPGTYTIYSKTLLIR